MIRRTFFDIVVAPPAGCCVFMCRCAAGTAAVTSPDSLAAPTVHSGSNPRWLRPCRSAEEVPLRRLFPGLCAIPAKSVAPTQLPGPPACRGTPRDRSQRYVWPALRVAVADCPCEDGPRLQPLPIAKSRGERSRRFPCKHAPVQLGFDGFDILYRLWTLPYNFLTRIVCATVSVIARRRRGSSARVENPTAPRFAAAATSAISAHLLCLAGLSVLM